MPKAKYSPPERELINEKFMDVTEPVAELAADLFDAHSFDIGHLRSLPIKYLLCRKPRRSKGRTVLGTAKVLSAKDRIYHGYRAEIILDEGYWNSPEANRRALLFHELMHLDYFEDEDELKIRGHDIEEFAAVVRNYGLWTDDSKRFVEVANQLTLDDIVPNTVSGIQRERLRMVEKAIEERTA